MLDLGYAIVWDAGVPEGEIYRTLDEARAARKAMLRGQSHMSDFCHVVSMTIVPEPGVHNNDIAENGCDRCECGCKYWENDRCIDCGLFVLEARVRV